MEQLKVKSFGPIDEININVGDLTLLVGPQASGKSIILQLLKLLIDKYHIRKTLQQYNYLWNKETDVILDLYFGEGMSKIWTPDTNILFNGKSVSIDFLLPKQGPADGKAVREAEEQLFYIPAQRILSVSDGRPKTFMEFDSSAPYVLRQFSETLRLMLQNDMGTSIFPLSGLLKTPLRKSFDDSIFHGGEVIMDDRTGQKKLRLVVDNMSVPFITWSAGQKEFMPLLMGFYRLCPPSKASRKDNYRYAVIEEPEMGLHPQAIKSVILQVLDLLSRGYKVIISTHSPVLLEFAWAFNLLKDSKAGGNDALYELFDIKRTAPTKRLLDNILAEKTINTYYFSRDNNENRVISKDISSLDAGSDDTAVAEWGGLSQFSSKATDIILKYLD